MNDEHTLEALRRMAAMLPALEKADPDALTSYSGGAALSLEGPLQEFHGLAYRGDALLCDFNWGAWQDEARRILASPETIALADMQTIRQLLTTLVRAEKFASGALAEAVRDKSLLNILRRLGELTK